MTTTDIIAKLEQLDYFKFLEEEDKEDFKNCLSENIENGWLDMPSQILLDLKRGNGIRRDKPESIDKRSVIVNGEYLFRGGLEATLNKFKPIFTARNLRFDFENNTEEYSGAKGNYLKHSITVNNRDCQFFNGEMERGDSEMVYLKSLINLLNSEMKEQGFSREQFVVLTSMETLFYLLIDSETEAFIKGLSNKVNNKIIDLNKY